MNMVFLIAAAVSTTALVTPTVAEARSFDSDAVTSETVDIGDLDLASANGQARLDRRVNAALRRVCGDPLDRIVRAGAEARACIAEGRRRTATQVELAAQKKSGSQVQLSAR